MAENVGDLPGSCSKRLQRAVLRFAPWQLTILEGFWRRLSSLKLDSWGLDSSPVDMRGFFAPCSHSEISSSLMLQSDSLPLEFNGQTLMLGADSADRNRCPIPGVLYNTNTWEDFLALSKEKLLQAAARKVWDDIHSGKAEEEVAVLQRFILVSFADLKNWKFYYQFASPALVLDPPATILHMQPAAMWLNPAEVKGLALACNEWRCAKETTEIPFFLISIASNSSITIKHLKEWKLCQGDDQKVLFGFYDPCHLPLNPGWPLRNFLAFIYSRYKVRRITFLCYRERHGSADLRSSLVGEAIISVPDGWDNDDHMPKVVGWEKYKGSDTFRSIDLAEAMDPVRLAANAADLNLKLMTWRHLPSLNLDMLSKSRCLLLGAGTLGCQVSRMLMAWGIRKITLLDGGRVAFSNPPRQSLYTFEDCLEGGEFKAVAAARSLKRIFPAVDAEGVIMTIPMPGHMVMPEESSKIIEDCIILESLIASHDVIFLLTDTRESRWLPTLFSTNLNKIAIVAALGFDSYLVMRHGASPLGIEAEGTKGGLDCKQNVNEKKRLGCYFCNDVVAPVDSTSNRTLDQQCTVVRPGLAPIASAIAVELLVGLLHHPDRVAAAGQVSEMNNGGNDQPFGILPHQIRGIASQFSQFTLFGHSSNCCIACSNTVIMEYRKRGIEFIVHAINQPAYLEDLTGVTELMKSTYSLHLDFDDESDGLASTFSDSLPA